MGLPQIKKFNAKITDQIENASSDLLIVLVGENEIQKKQIKSGFLSYLDNICDGIISQLLSFENFTGKWLETTYSLIPQQKIGKRIALIGTGSKTDLSQARVREMGVQSAYLARKLKSNDVFCIPSSQLVLSLNDFQDYILLGFNLGLYKFHNTNMSDDIKKELKNTLKFTLYSKEKLQFSKSSHLVNDSINFCRLLQDGSPNIVNPKFVSSSIKTALTGKKNVKVSVLGKKKLEEMGFNAMLAVAGGSAEEPQLVVVEYKPKKYDKTLAFVGKGLTMDTGGYSLKTPSTYQEGMKYDMSGAAIVLSAISAIAELELPIHVYAVGALCENMVDAHAYRVGDILTSYSGKTIEVLNTDAEGRVVLSDALYYTSNDLKADYIIEYSTLTGAMISALGHTGAGLFSHNKELIDVALQACHKTGDKAHPLPMWEEICDDIKGTISDVCNINLTRGAAGSITAAAFLNHFVKEVPYLHIDVAGVADNIKAIGYARQKGSSGYGVQLSVEIAKILSESSDT